MKRSEPSSGEAGMAGPVGLLMKSLASARIMIDCSWVLHAIGLCPISLLHGPWQEVVKFAQTAFMNANVAEVQAS
eukprot:9449234-Alexandrium_andersonii.AAC.1